MTGKNDCKDENWKFRKRNYLKEKLEYSLHTESVTSHPLKSQTISNMDSFSKKVSVDGLAKENHLSNDPLSVLTNMSLSDTLASVDPLSQMVMLESRNEKESNLGNVNIELNWNERKFSIINRYSTSEKLSVAASLLAKNDTGSGPTKKQEPELSVSEKVRNRLEQLGDGEDTKIKAEISQQEFIKRIEELKQNLISAWGQDQRVKSLKIVIQCVKLLAEPAGVIHFYPSTFVLVTDILDTFGGLVYDRIMQKCHDRSLQLQPGRFQPQDVPSSAKETCKNWFYKIASIRELIPRFYIDAALLRCYEFLSLSDRNSNVDRMTSMILGIGNPLVAVYAGAYLCRVGKSMTRREFTANCFSNFLCTFSQLESPTYVTEYKLQKLDVVRYNGLYQPALEWMLDCVFAYMGSGSAVGFCDDVLDKAGSNGLILASSLKCFDASYVSQNEFKYIDLIKQLSADTVPKHELYSLLGCKLLTVEPIDKLKLIREVWKEISKISVPLHYMSVTNVWIEFVAKYFESTQVNKILWFTVKLLTPNKAYAELYPQLTSMTSKIIEYCTDFAELFNMDSFLPFLDLLHLESVKVAASHSILAAFSTSPGRFNNEPMLQTMLLSLMKTVHDSINAMTNHEETIQHGIMLAAVIGKVAFGTEFENQLAFYVLCRSQLSNLEAVLIQLVHFTNAIAMEIHRLVNGKHTKKTGGFVRACVAYCFITIPSITDYTFRLSLYLASAQTALMNECNGQCEALVKNAILTLTDLPRYLNIHSTNHRHAMTTDGIFLEWSSYIASFLLAVPDNPDQGVLVLFRGLLNVVEGRPLDGDHRTGCYMMLLALVQAMCQETYIYNVGLANDTLYGSDPKFINELTAIGSTLQQKIRSCGGDGHLSSGRRKEVLLLLSTNGA